jgi:hypothetical protein
VKGSETFAFFISNNCRRDSFVSDGACVRAGAGFRSKSTYGSGFFHMRMKLPSGYTAGVVTTFYVSPADLRDRDVDVVVLRTIVYSLLDRSPLRTHLRPRNLLHIIFDVSLPAYLAAGGWEPRRGGLGVPGRQGRRAHHPPDQRLRRRPRRQGAADAPLVRPRRRLPRLQDPLEPIPARVIYTIYKLATSYSDRPTDRPILNHIPIHFTCMTHMHLARSQDVRGRHAGPGAEEPDGRRAGVPVPGEADDADPRERVGRLRLGHGRRPDQGGLVQGPLHRRLPGLRRRRLRQQRERRVPIARPMVERRRVPEHHRGAAGGVRGREEELYELRLLRR